MKTLAATSAVLGVALVLGGQAVERAPATISVSGAPVVAVSSSASAEALTHAQLNDVVQRVCVVCHNSQLLTGGLSLEGFDVAQIASKSEVGEKMIKKLRAGMMPPRLAPYRPGGDTLDVLAETMEGILDKAASSNPNPGNRVFQRLNRTEYAQSVKDLLDLEVDAGKWLPLDTKSANFDNIADAQALSPTLLDAMLNAAAEVSRLALGDPDAVPSEALYKKSGYYSQYDQVEGAPFGTRGGITAMHNFPADGEYVFKMAFDHTTTGGYYGSSVRYEQIEVSIDGEPVATQYMDQWMSTADANMVNMNTDPIFVRAGPHRVTAAFVKQFEGPMEDLVSPHDWSLTDRQIGAGGYGITAPPHIKDLVVSGPFNASGVSETPSRKKVFSCRPTSAAEAPACAREIVSRLSAEAYRRPVTEQEVKDLLTFYELGVEDGGFELGIRNALQAILASPDFVFRFEPASAGKSGETYRITDSALASRLSFFLWGTPPDAELTQLADQGKLSNKGTLERQVQRMLADPRSEALATRFAAQWLRLPDMNLVHPDAYWFPNFHQKLAEDMRHETELFFYNLVREDKSFLEFYTADYTFVNEPLAKHYGIPGVTGEEFRRVSYPDETRRGILGHGSLLLLTSVANRTSPVLRGKYVMEVLIGTPPPPPPAGVPALEETKGSTENRVLTTRERMEKHRANPVCNGCHQFMDPIGLALDNFDVTGKWRIRENGAPLDTQSQFYDATPISTPGDLRAALMRRPIPLVRTFTENMMAYALGRRIEFYDKPTVRAIAKQAEANGYRMSSFIMGIVNSPAFQMKADPTVVDQANSSQQ